MKKSTLMNRVAKLMEAAVIEAAVLAERERCARIARKHLAMFVVAEIEGKSFRQDEAHARLPRIGKAADLLEDKR